MTLRAPFLRRSRGAAAVETAVLMIVLIPLIMYTLFLEDLLAYRLEQDETVYSAAWDPAGFDFRHNLAIGSKAEVTKSNDADIVSYVSKGNRLIYGDHTSAYNDYKNTDASLDDNHHHQALTAHQCWLSKTGQQVVCEVDQGVGRPDLTFGFLLTNAGGQITCGARLGVQNYFIPQHFLQSFSQVDLTQQDRHMRGNSLDPPVHAEAKTDAYAFPMGYFSVVHDSWAINWVKDGAPGVTPTDRTKGHVEVDPASHPKNVVTKPDELSRWMMVPFGLRAGMTAKAEKFGLDAVKEGFLLPTALVDGVGDVLATGPLAFSKDKTKKFANYYPSGWADSRARSMTGPAQDAYFRKAANRW
jgi:hypothetical protein